MKIPDRLAVTLLTGFLGSGKSTVLREILRSPAWADTALLINELGSVGLDHQLMWNTGAQVELVQNGCVCCTMNGDLVGSLEEMFWKRLRREIPYFRRVVIETTGLADPRPIVSALRSTTLLVERYRLAAIACTVDAEYGLAQLDKHPESLAQAACADVLLVTKSDLVDAAQADLLDAQLDRINPMATRHRAVNGQMSPRALDDLMTSFNDPGGRSSTVSLALPMSSRSMFHDRVSSFVTRFEQPWQAEELERVLHGIASQHGDDIYRIKGIVALNDGSHVVVHVVHHTVFPFEAIQSPAIEGAGFIVCIGSGLAKDDIAAQLLQPGTVLMKSTNALSGAGTSRLPG